MKSAVIYAAKSTEDKHGSIPDQLADCLALAEKRGLEVVAEYQDEAASAFHGNRGPELAQAMEHCERLGSRALIVQHSDRLARGDGKEARHLIEIVLWALKHGVELLSVQDPEILAGGDMALLLGAVGGMRNHQDSKRKGLAVKGGMRRRAVERRQFIGGRRPYGYRHRDRTDDGRGTGPLVVEEAEAAVVRRIFGEYLAGVSQRSIAIGLNEDRVPTLTGTTWYATTVAGMLRNALYKGCVTHNGESYPAVAPDGTPTLEPIIDTPTWERARQQRDAASSGRGGGRGRRPRGSHALTGGLLVCRCGAPMSPVTKPTRTPGQLYEVYTCTRRLHHGSSACPQPPIKRTAVDRALWSYFAEVALDVDATRETLNEQARQRLAELTALSQQTDSELARAEARLERITRGWQDQVIDDEEYKRQRDDVLAERDAARAQSEQHARQQEGVESSIAAFDAETEMLEELTALRRLIVGEAQTANSEGLQSVRLALRRLFTGFELVPLGGRPHFGTGELRGELWQGESVPSLERDGTAYVLWPYVRSGAMQSPDEAGEGWPALHRTALALRDNFHSFFFAW